MSRAIVARAFAVAALGSVLLLWSDSRGDAPPQKSKSAAKAPAAAKSAGKTDSHSKSKQNKPSVPEAASGGEAKIEAELAKPFDMEFQDTPLKDIVDSISAKIGVALVLDTKALADASVTPDTTFTKTIRDIPLRSELRLLLADHDLGYYVDNDVLLITTNDISKAHTVIRVYDVSAFAETAESLSWASAVDAPQPAATPRTITGPANSPTAKPAATPSNPASTKARDRNRIGGTCGGLCPPVRPDLRPGEVDYDALNELITGTLAPTTWDTNGGTGSISFFGGKMVVAQTEEIHRQLADFLAGLKPRATPIPLSMSGPPAVSKWEAKIEKALDQPIDMEYQDTPLKDIVDSLSSQLRITILLDNKALADASVTPDTTFTKTLRGISLREGLHLLLADHDLSYFVSDDVLLITTNDIAKARTHIVIYSVDDLLGTAGSLGKDRYDELVETIVGTVAPTTWDSNGGTGSIAPFARSKLLVVDQTQEVQNQVKDLLMKLAVSKSPSPKMLPAKLAPVQAEPTSNDGIELHAYDVRAWSVDDNAQKQAPQFVELAKKLIEPKSWNQPGVFIGVVGQLVVVRQTPAVHRQIQKLVDVLANPSYPPQPVTTIGAGSGMGGGFDGGTPTH